MLKIRGSLIANDRWGFRELYYYLGEKLILFATEVKAILCHRDVQRKLDDLSVIDFLHCGYILNDRTFIKGISLILPGCTLVIDGDSTTLRDQKIRYEPILKVKSYKNHVDEVFKALKLSVERRLRWHQNIAMMLSGGLDSRLLLGIATKYTKNIKAFTLGGLKCREYLIAQKVVATLSLDNHTTAEPTWEHLKRYASALVWLGDGMISLGFVSTSFRTPYPHIWQQDLVLGGFGGDHTIGGSRFTEKLLKESVDGHYLMELLLRRTRAVGDIRPYADALFNKAFREKFAYYCEKNVK
jgi:asparagine synthetase B (glutamine-hydrolysing)